MAQVLPFQPSIPSYRVGTVINGTPYIFDVRWNARDAAWYFDLYDKDEVAIVMGVKVVLGAGLGSRVRDDRYPAGLVVAIDVTGAGADATIDDIGKRVLVVHFTPEDIDGATV